MAPQKASTASQARKEEERQRNLLFDGPDPASGGGAGPEQSGGGTGAPEGREQTVGQLVNQAVVTHKDSTKTANRALQVVEQTRALQKDTMKALEQQGRQMESIDRNMSVMNVELSYSEKLLLYMRRCCCCALFDCCTGADPEKRIKGNWKKRAATGKTDAHAAAMAADPFAHLKAQAAAAQGKTPAATAAAGVAAAYGDDDEGEGAAATGPKYRDPNIRLVEGMESTETQLHEESRKQNQAMDQILAGLEDIKQGAVAMSDELSRQQVHIEHADGRLDHTAGRMLEINTKSQLGDYRTKVQGPKGNSSMNLKKTILTHALNL